jgi:3-oxoacyl-[acyl-carrier protein] reductase
MKLQGQVAIVTGAGRGIGRAIALRFAREGAAVCVTARSQQEIDAVSREIASAGGRALAVAANVAREAECENIVRATRETLGPARILVNNAGIFGPVKPAEEITAAEWDEALAVNLRGPFLLCRLVLPEMYARGSGVILNISSVAAKMAYTWEAPYAASKAGLLGLTRCLAAEGARKGVRVNALCPGPVFETKMSQDLGQELSRKLKQDAAQQVKDFANTVLQGRGQTAEEIAAAALFLVSSDAGVITAQSVNADGGMAYF